MRHKETMIILMMDTYLTVGGVATYLKTLAGGLIERGHTIYLVTAADEENREIIQNFRSIGIKVITVADKKNKVLKAYQFVKSTLRVIKENPVDIIHSHHRIVNFAGMLISKISGVPHLITLHVIKKDFKLLLQLWKNEPITVPSKALKMNLIEHYGLKRGQIQVIYNSIAADYIVNPAKRELFQKTIFNSPEAFYVSFVGRISYEKGADVLVAAIPLVKKQYPNIAFRIFGDGDEVDKLKKQCRELEVDPDQIFRGTNHNVNELLSLTDVCVIPSRSESFSLFALECMRAKKPVIASAVGGLPEVVVDNKTGVLVEAEDIKALARSIIKLYENQNLIDDFAENGYQRVKEKFPLDTFYQDYESEYQSVVKRS